MSDSLQPHWLYSSWNSPGQNSRVGSRSLLQGIFPTEGSNPGLPHCRQILYQLRHKGSPRILEWGSLSLLQRIFLTQESNQGLLHCSQIVYQLTCQGSPIRPTPSYLNMVFIVYFCTESCLLEKLHFPSIWNKLSFQILSKWYGMDTMSLIANIQISLYRKEKLRASAAP